jgi:hypothetical protein
MEQDTELNERPTNLTIYQAKDGMKSEPIAESHKPAPTRAGPDDDGFDVDAVLGELEKDAMEQLPQTNWSPQRLEYSPKTPPKRAQPCHQKIPAPASDSKPLKAKTSTLSKAKTLGEHLEDGIEIFAASISELAKSRVDAAEKKGVNNIALTQLSDKLDRMDQAQNQQTQLLTAMLSALRDISQNTSNSK